MKLKDQYWILIISFFGALLYIQTANYGYTGDDGIYAYFNRVTKEGLGNWMELFRFGSMNFIEIEPSNTSIYRPFTLLTFAIEHQIFGEFDPHVGHVFNVVLYFALLWVIGKLMLELAAKRGLPSWLPLLILLVYAVHPIHTEVVASVKSRDTLLSGLFAFSAILLWLRWNAKPTTPQWAILLVLYFFSLISKEESIPLMALIPLIGWFFLGLDLSKALKSVLPFLVPFLIYMGMRAAVLDSTSGSNYGSFINSVMYLASGMDWLATNFYIYILYIKLLFFPHPLSWDYSFSQIEVQTLASPLVWLSLLFFGAMIYFAYKGFKTRSLFSFGILFYLCTFSIFANLIPSLIIGSNLGERFLFTPSLAFSFLLVYGLYYFVSKRNPSKVKAISLAVVLPICLLFSIKTIARSQVWESNMTLSASGVDTSPNSWRTHINHAEELRLQGKSLEKSAVDSARSYFEKAIIHYDRGFEILGNNNTVPRYYSTLAEVLLGVGDSVRAEEVLRLSVQKAKDIFYPLFKLGGIEFNKGNYEEARDFYLKALDAKRPDLYSTYKNLGNSYYRLGDQINAIKSFESARKEKEDPEINRMLVLLYTDLGLLDKAADIEVDSTFNIEKTAFLLAFQAGNDFFQRKDYKNAVLNYKKIESEFEANGGSAAYPTYYAAFGKALIESKDTLEAKKKFVKAFELNPKDPVVLTNLGIIALLKEKRYADAERYFRSAIDANHEDPFSARTNLGTTLILERKEREAILAFEDALKYGSNDAVLGNLYLLNKAVGNEERAAYYQGLLNK